MSATLQIHLGRNQLIAAYPSNLCRGESAMTQGRVLSAAVSGERCTAQGTACECVRLELEAATSFV